MQKNKGPSETTREAWINSKIALKLNFNNYFKHAMPKQIKHSNFYFLEWFVGFFEAKGSFSNWFDGKRHFFQIEIHQNDPKLMYKIKKNLGFGQIIEFSKNNQQYWRYSTSNFINLQRLIFLFNGNLVTSHKNLIFSHFVEQFTNVYNISIILLKPKIKFSLESYWLSGFFEGIGGFWATQRKNLKEKQLNSGLEVKFYIIQQEELILLNYIKVLFHIPTNVYKTFNKNTLTKYNCLETCNLESLKYIKAYLEKYPFLGKKKILIKRWIRLIDYKLNDYPFTLKSIKKLNRLVNSIKKI